MATVELKGVQDWDEDHLRLLRDELMQAERYSFWNLQNQIKKVKEQKEKKQEQYYATDVDDNSEGPYLRGFPGLYYWQGAKILVDSADAKLRAVGICSVARSCCPITLSMDAGTVTMTDGTILSNLSRREMYLAALRCDPQCAFAYSELGWTMSGDEELELPDGRCVTGTDLLTEPLKYEPTSAMLFARLGYAMKRNTTVTSPDGRTFTKHQAYVEAVRLAPDEASSYLALFRLLHRDELDLDDSHVHQADQPASQEADTLRVTLADGRKLDKAGLLWEAVRLQPQDDDSRQRLRTFLPSSTVWTPRNHAIVFDGRTNFLFATLLLGLQRLETDGALPLAHHSMLEDMLEAWTLSDCCSTK